MGKRGWYLLLLAALVGCGGGLKYRVEDSAMDNVPDGERPAVAAARLDLAQAWVDKHLVERQRQPLEQDRDLTEKERRQVQADIDRAVASQEAAVKARDEARSRAAERAKEIADFAMKTTDAKLDWLLQKRDWLRAASRAADARIDDAAAKVELEKARVAKHRGIKTRDDHSLTSFESQWADKTAVFQRARDNAAEQEKKAKDLEQKWRYLRTQQEKLHGGEARLGPRPSPAGRARVISLARPRGVVYSQTSTASMEIS